MTLLVLLMGIVSATDISDNSTSTAGDVTKVVDDSHTVSQTDTTTDEIQTEESSTKTIKKNNAKDLNTKKESTLTANSWDTFVTAFNDAKTKTEDTTIFLEQGTYINNGTLTWDNSNIALTIDGNNQTVNGNQTQVFVINSGCSMILKNITITNATAEYGGAIYNKGTLTVTNSTLNNNKAKWGGAIYNKGTLTVTNSTLNNNKAEVYGGAIENDGTLTVTYSTLNNNKANEGGAIDSNIKKYFDIVGCNFTKNHATECGGAIYSYGYLNATGNNFIENTAGNKETIDLYGWWNGLFSDNHYYSTDISLNEIKLSVKDDKQSFKYGENVELEFNLQPTSINYYFDFADGINDITLYINGKENLIGKYEAYNLTKLKPGEYNVNFTSCNSWSNTVTFTVSPVDSEITTDKESYDCYEGIKNMVQLDITDESGQRGTANVSVKDGDEYTELLTCHNVKDGYTIQTATLAEALANIYDDLDPSYTINVTYYSDYTNPSSTEFALNIIKQRNTSITYDILNNTERNVQINITVTDTAYQSPIANAPIEVTGAINTNTTSGVLKDNKLTPGNYKINVYYDDTNEYKASNATIVFTVEIDKDEKIAQLEKQNKQLTEQLAKANKEIKTLNDTNKQLNNKLDKANKENKELNNTVNNLTKQLNTANKEITTLKNTNKNLNNKLDKANKEIKTLNSTVNNLTKQLNTANKEIATLKNTNKNLNNKLDKANKEIKTLNNTVNYLTKQLDTADKEIKKLNNYIDKLLNTTKLNTTITVNQIKSTVGSVVTLTAKIKDEKGKAVTDGRVIFKVNGITLKDENKNTVYAIVSNGTATMKYKVQTVWIKNTSYIEAVYGGSNKYASSRTNSTTALKISQGTAKITLTPSKITVKSGQKITLRAKVTDASGDRINREKVAFKLNGKTLKDNKGNTLYAKVVDGEAVLDYTIPSTYDAKTYNLTAVFGGGNYKQATATGKLTIEKKSVGINVTSITTKKGKTTVKAKIYDETGKLLVRNTKLAIKINGKTVLTGVNSTKGIVDMSFITSLKPGLYELLLISGENGIYNAGKVTTVLKI